MFTPTYSGQIAFHSRAAKDAMETGDSTRAFAATRLAASLVFLAHPELREYIDHESEEQQCVDYLF